jgi:hypothetical protein
MRGEALVLGYSHRQSLGLIPKKVAHPLSKRINASTTGFESRISVGPIGPLSLITELNRLLSHPLATADCFRSPPEQKQPPTPQRTAAHKSLSSSKALNASASNFAAQIAVPFLIYHFKDRNNGGIVRPPS